LLLWFATAKIEWFQLKPPTLEKIHLASLFFFPAQAASGKGLVPSLVAGGVIPDNQQRLEHAPSSDLSSNSPRGAALSGPNA
jgi:hypothetical protein